LSVHPAVFEMEKPEKFWRSFLDLFHLFPLPLLSSIVYKDLSLNSCPPGLALALAPGLQPGRHPDRLQMSVGVGLHQALVLWVRRRRINGLYLRASLLVLSRVWKSEEGTSCFSSPNTNPTDRAELSKFYSLAWKFGASGPLSWFPHFLSKLTLSILEHSWKFWVIFKI
jgi:hypothetical protein